MITGARAGFAQSPPKLDWIVSWLRGLRLNTAWGINPNPYTELQYLFIQCRLHLMTTSFFAIVVLALDETSGVWNEKLDGLSIWKIFFLPTPRFSRTKRSSGSMQVVCSFCNFQRFRNPGAHHQCVQYLCLRKWTSIPFASIPPKFKMLQIPTSQLRRHNNPTPQFQKRTM